MSELQAYYNKLLEQTNAKGINSANYSLFSSLPTLLEDAINEFKRTQPNWIFERILLDTIQFKKYILELLTTNSFIIDYLSHEIGTSIKDSKTLPPLKSAVLVKEFPTMDFNAKTVTIKKNIFCKRSAVVLVNSGLIHFLFRLSIALSYYKDRIETDLTKLPHSKFTEDFVDILSDIILFHYDLMKSDFKESKYNTLLYKEISSPLVHKEPHLTSAFSDLSHSYNLMLSALRFVISHELGHIIAQHFEKQSGTMKEVDIEAATKIQNIVNKNQNMEIEADEIAYAIIIATVVQIQKMDNKNQKQLLLSNLIDGALIFLLTLDLLEGCQEAIRSCHLKYNKPLGDLFESTHPTTGTRIQLQDRYWKRVREYSKGFGFELYDYYKQLFKTIKPLVEKSVVRKLGGDEVMWEKLAEAKSMGEEFVDIYGDNKEEMAAALRVIKQQLQQERNIEPQKPKRARPPPVSQKRRSEASVSDMANFLKKLDTLTREANSISNRTEKMKKQAESNKLTHDFVLNNKDSVYNFVNNFCINFESQDPTYRPTILYLIYFIANEYGGIYKDKSLFKLAWHTSLKYKVVDGLYSQIDIDRLVY